MPKISKLGQSDIEKSLDILSGYIKAEQARRWDNKIPYELIASMRISESTYFKRKRNPGDMRVEELLRMSKKLGIPVSVLIGETEGRTDL